MSIVTIIIIIYFYFAYWGKGASVEIRGQLAGVSICLLPCGCQGLNFGCQLWSSGLVVSLRAGPAHWPWAPLSSGIPQSDSDCQPVHICLLGFLSVNLSVTQALVKGVEGQPDCVHLRPRQCFCCSWICDVSVLFPVFMSPPPARPPTTHSVLTVQCSLSTQAAGGAVSPASLSRCWGPVKPYSWFTCIACPDPPASPASVQLEHFTCFPWAKLSG